MNISLLYTWLPQLLWAASISLQIATLSCLIGIILGTILGIILAQKRSMLTISLELITGIIRGTPMLIQIFIMFYVFPQIGLFMLSAFWTATLAIGINSASYISVIVRTGIASVGKGQIEAGKVLGLSDSQIAWYIVLPQAFRTIFPALGNELVTLIKDSSLASTIGVVELSKQGSIIRSLTYDAVTVYCGICLIYLLMTGTVSLCMSYLEKRINNKHAHH